MYIVWSHWGTHVHCLISLRYTCTMISLRYTCTMISLRYTCTLSVSLRYTCTLFDLTEVHMYIVSINGIKTIILKKNIGQWDVNHMTLLIKQWCQFWRHQHTLSLVHVQGYTSSISSYKTRCVTNNNVFLTVIIAVILFLMPSVQFFPVISWREQVKFWPDDDACLLVLYQHAGLNF
jgi:hypothetical protein